MKIFLACVFFWFSLELLVVLRKTDEFARDNDLFGLLFGVVTSGLFMLWSTYLLCWRT